MDRPRVHINCASTLDGKISRPDGSRLRISGPWDIERVHRLRAEMGSILLGAGTVVTDDPKLTVKDSIVADARPLNKIVLDGAGRISAASKFLRTPGRSILVTSHECNPDWYDMIGGVAESEGLEMELMRIKGEGGRVDLSEALFEIRKMGIDSILVEGGASTIWEFVSAGLFDIFTVYYGPMLVGGSGPTVMGGAGFPDRPLEVEVVGCTPTPDGGVLVEFAPYPQ
ncbi:MAG: RibD family protein [Thermoplasmatota archaeon]